MTLRMSADAPLETQTANSRLRESAASKAHKKTHLSKAERAPDARRARALRCSGIPSRKQKPLHPSSSLLPLVYGKILPRFSSLRKQKIRPKLCRYCQLTSLFRVRLAEFRPAGRNKMEIHVIRRLCRPDRTAVSGFTAYGCRVPLAGKHTEHLASVSFSRGA